MRSCSARLETDRDVAAENEDDEKTFYQEMLNWRKACVEVGDSLWRGARK